MRVIAIVGPIASGKGVVVDYLKEKSFCSFSLSDQIREEVQKNGKKITRDNLRDTANRLRKELGPDVLARRTVEKIKKTDCEKVVIDSIRNPFEVAHICKELNALVLGITAKQKRRYKFLKSRNRDGDVKSYQEFVKHDDEELFSGVNHKMNIKDALDKADHIIDNNGTINDLKRKVDEFLDNL